MTSAKRAQRDRDIFLRYRSGASTALLAQRFNLAPQRIQQIVGSMRELAQADISLAQTYTPIALDKITQAEIEAAKREAPRAPPFRGRVGF